MVLFNRQRYTASRIHPSIILLTSSQSYFTILPTHHSQMMPSFYPAPLSRQLPPTPSKYVDVHPGMSRDPRQLPALQLLTHNIPTPSHEFDRFEALDSRSRIMQYSHASGSQSSHALGSDNRGQMNNTAPLQAFSNRYDVATSMPTLPPISIPHHQLDEHQQHARSKGASAQSQQKEEKPLGGVATHLDYEMDDMVDFVSVTAQGMYEIYCSKICLADIDISRSVLDSRISVHADFRKYVSQVLSSTRLPSSTILLGLHYLSSRMTLLSIEGQFGYGGGQVHRMLTIALLLGSKFLDDNTFQNRSWSEVSNIPVGDLNVLEMEWLLAIDWNMHIDPRDRQGFSLWHEQWQRYQISKANKIEPLVQSLVQTHIHGISTPQQQSFHQVPSPASHNTSAYADRYVGRDFEDNAHSQWFTPRYNTWQSSRSQMDYSPPSAPETGPNTPDWYGTLNRFGYGGGSHQNYPSMKLPTPLQVAGPTGLPHHGYNTPYVQQYNSYGHGSSCPCGYCMSHHERFFMNTGYAPQSVVG